MLYVLFEHASGYGLFSVKEFEEVGAFIPEVEAAATQAAKFQQVVKLVGFKAFTSAASALENINAISEGLLTEDLGAFLETNLPKAGKKNKVQLGVSDTKLGAAINEELGVSVTHIGVIPEIVRGIRTHLDHFVKGLTPASMKQTELGLGHSYSRGKVKFNVNRVDNMIIQSIALVDQLDKDINTFAMRIKEWYSYHFPELARIVTDNYQYGLCADFIKDRKHISEESLEKLEEIVMDSAKAQAILDASRMSMGMDISPIDLMNIERFAKRVIGLSEYRKQLAEYLKSKMSSVAPNLSVLIGEVVGARLISHAGSLTNLAKYPASTVQILGAEKALFRAIKTRSNTPKYGLIYHSTFIGRAGTANKGRISRYLANKCAIASRIDCFTGDAEEMPKKKKNKKKHIKEEADAVPKEEADVVPKEEGDAVPKEEADVVPKEEGDAVPKEETVAEPAENGPVEKKKKRKRKSGNIGVEEPEVNGGEDLVEEKPAVEVPKKKKKKKDVSLEGQDLEMHEEAEQVVEDPTEQVAKKKKKKKKQKQEQE